MIDRMVQNKVHNYVMPEKKNDINVKTFGDLHYFKGFDDKKLEIIEENLASSPLEYLCMAGDIIDSVDFLKTDKAKAEKLLYWLEDLGKKYKTFVNLGSHDFTTCDFKQGKYAFPEEYWKEANQIKNVHVSHYDPYYEDEKVIIYSLELPYQYYFNSGNCESKEWLLGKLEIMKRFSSYISHLDNSKVKILIVHSPIYMTDPDIIKCIREFDFVFCGHMHNGMVFPVIDDIIRNNKGIIAPNKSLFPDNARGSKVITINGHEIHLIINGGITKLQESAGFLEKFNVFYPMSIDEVKVNSRKLQKK